MSALTENAAPAPFTDEEFRDTLRELPPSA